MDCSPIKILQKILCDLLLFREVYAIISKRLAGQVINRPVRAWGQNLIKRGGIAQLGERLNGIQEVSGSNPLISTRKLRTKKASNLTI